VERPEPEVVRVDVAADALVVDERLPHPREVDVHRAFAVDARELLLGFQKVRLVGGAVPLLGRELDQIRVLVDQHRDRAGPLCRLPRIVAGVQRRVGRDHQGRPAAIPPRLNPVVRVVDALGSRHAGELPLALVGVMEVPLKYLFEATADVCRNGLGVVERRLGRHVDPTDVVQLEPFSLHQPVGGVRAHRDDVLVSVREGTGVQPQPLRVLFGRIAHLRRERLREIEFEFARTDFDGVDAYVCHVGAVVGVI